MLTDAPRVFIVRSCQIKYFENCHNFFIQLNKIFDLYHLFYYFFLVIYFRKEYLKGHKNINRFIKLVHIFVLSIILLIN